jgi:hypothetical protein
MSFGRYLLGAGELAVVAVSVGYGAARLRSRLLPGWMGAPARLAEIVIGTSAMLLAIELVGTAQILQPASVLAAGVLVGLSMAWFGRPLGPGVGEERPAPPQMGRPATAVALAVMFVVAMHWGASAQHSYSVGMYGGDENWYHLVYPARFAQDGAITALHFASPAYLSWFHPANSELFHAMGMVVFDRDILSPWLNLVWMAVALLAAWCIGRPFGVAPLAAAATALALDLPVFEGTQAGAAMSDLFGVTFLLAAVALLLNAGFGEGPDGRRVGSQARSALAIAALAAGLSLGAKLIFAAPIVVLTIGVIALADRGMRWRTTLLWVLPALLTGSFWYMRNFVNVLNPFPYVSKLGPIDLPGPDEGLNGGPPFSVAHYVADGTVWREHLAPGLSAQLGPVWFLLLAGAILGIVLGLVQRRSPMSRVFAAVALVALLFWFLTPAAAEGPEGNPVSFPAGLRVLEPALIMGLILSMLAAARLERRWQWAALLATAILALVATRRGLDFWDSAGQLAGAVLIAAALVLLPIAVVIGGGRGAGGRLAAALGLATVALLALGLGWPRTQDYFDHRYRTADVPPLFASLNIVPLYRWASGIHDRRIGTSGILQYGLYGEDLSNHVQFLGRVGSDDSFRDITDCRTWRENINAGDYDYVVAMPKFGGKRELQARWTRDPNSRVVLHSAPITVFRLTGKLDPARCGTLPSL